MSLKNALHVPVFYFSLEQMQNTTLPEAVDWCRSKKGADKYPFFMIRTDPRFWQSIKVNAETIPLEIDFATTQVSLKEIHPGIYRAKTKPAAAEERKEPLDNSDAEAAAAEEQEKFRVQLLEHLEQMKKQPKLNEEEQKKLLETIGSRESMGKLAGFKYKEHLDFSAMDNVASTLPDFPVGWNLNKLPGRLTELLKDTEPIYGVSTSFCYAGTLATWSMSHVENGDLLSANILLENSAGKAWTGFNPCEEKKINPIIAAASEGPRKNCISPLLHTDTMFDNEVYDEKSMEWYYCIQGPGDFVITNPMGVHQVHNLGYNIAEATNFISHDYRKIARRRKACQCPGRLMLYKDSEQWNTLADYVYHGELDILNATFATANLPVAQLREIYRTIPEQVEESEEEVEADQGDVNVAPMESLMNALDAAINGQDREEPVDFFADNDDGNEDNEPLEQNEPLEEDNESPSRDQNPWRIQRAPDDDVVIAAAFNAINNMNNATQKQKRADAHADWYSQRQRQGASKYQTKGRERSPRGRAGEIRRNKHIADKYKESRANARNAYRKRNPEIDEYRIRESGPVSIWFKRKLEDCRGAIQRATPRIEEFKVTGKWFRNINFSLRMATAEAKIQILHRRRQLYNALVKMYHRCPRVLQERIEEGYYEKEVIRDFILYHNESHRVLLTTALESLNADMEYWNNVFASEELWNEEFGVDSNYRIPSLDWCTKNF